MRDLSVTWPSLGNFPQVSPERSGRLLRTFSTWSTNWVAEHIHQR